MLFLPFASYLSFLLIHYLKVVTWFPFSLFFGILVCLYIVTSRIKTPEYTATADMNCVTKIEINDKEVIGIAPDKTVKETLTSYTNFLVIRDGIFLITYNNDQKKK